MSTADQPATPGGLPSITAVMALLVGLVGCDLPDDPPSDADTDIRPETGPPVCTDGPPAPAVDVRTGLAALGPASRAPRRSGPWIFIVQSGSNTVGRFERRTGDYARDFIDVGANRNPYGLAVDPEDDRAWITNWLTDSVTVADTARGRRIAEFDHTALDHPADVVLTRDLGFVANTAFEGNDQYGEGRVVAVDRSEREVRTTVATRWKNPQYLRIVGTPRGRRLAVVDSGAITRSGDTTSLAGLELWPLSESLPENRRSAFPLGVDRDANIGAPGRPLPVPDAPHLYFTSATAPVLFKFDLADNRWLRDTDDPIELYRTDQKSLNRGAVGPRGILYVAAFNRDAVYAFDSTCDRLLAGPIDLDLNPEQPDGPIGLVPIERGDATMLYVTHSVGNRLDRIRFHFDASTQTEADDVRTGP